MRKQVLTKEQFAMIHLLGGWIGVNPSGLAREIGQSCARLELDINKLQFKFALADKFHQRSRSSTICGQRKIYSTWGNLLIPYIIYTNSISLKKYAKLVVLTSLVGSISVAILPVLKRCLVFRDKSYSGFEIMFLILFTMVLFQNAQTLFLLSWKYKYISFFFFFCKYKCLKDFIIKKKRFGNVIALDFRRRYDLVRLTTRLIRPGKDPFNTEYMRDTYRQHLFPIEYHEQDPALTSSSLHSLEFSCHDTVYNWSLLRSFFLDFGLHFLRREEGDLAVLVLTMAMLYGTYFVLVFSDGIGPRSQVFDGTFVLALGVFLMLPALFSLGYADKVNSKLDEQRYFLAETMLKLKNEELNHKSEYGCSQNSIRRSTILMEKIIDMLNSDKFRIRFLGYNVDTTTTGVIATVIGSVGFGVGRVVANSIN
ncbi:hypothetical protein RFI_07149 [Reticulomyxa filosa]|uniref:Uncharacterized protein n=1 Tax=Reticulomyxa filosa TaxID=46433 RepID=X6NXH4_RETFI|nr:hypothetical protein RFI_07149 [Reticulomyxa filosa]|eukprot:ETO29967.1 hypothetical protein RFI_07149 [Reticulomyxa filosa]